MGYTVLMARTQDEKRPPGRPPKPGKGRAFTVRINAELYRQLRHYAVDQDISFSDVADRALGEWWRAQTASARYADAKGKVQ